MEGNMAETLSSGPVSTRLQRIAELAKRSPGMVFTSLSHVIDIELLESAHQRTRKDGAVGVDGRTAAEYSKDLRRNLELLESRLKTGTYLAPPVRRVHISKGEGKTRPIGIPTYEDKVLQRAVALVLEAIYEQDFRNCSWGFRPGRSAHGALAALRAEMMDMDGGWVLEVDIQSFFDTLDHRHLRSFLDQRVRDGVLRRAIDKWLKAGVLEEGSVRHSEQGTPQGGVISPLLANVYLHHVLDVWFEDEVKPGLGRARLIRYADDAVMVFEREVDARRVLEELGKRFEAYGLSLHPDKTRLVPFQRPSFRAGSGQGRASWPGTFDLLGFTHLWRRTRHGGWAIQRQTAASRYRRALRSIYEWCRDHRHLPLAEQRQTLGKKLRGHYAYYGITWNAAMLERFYRGVRDVWFKWLGRRSQRGMNWSRFLKLEEHYPLPKPVLVHSVYRPQQTRASKSRMR
jgi:group II intron reverse transcriptase/maturase